MNDSVMLVCKMLFSDEFILANMKMFLHFILFLDTKVEHVVILPHVWKTYTCRSCIVYIMVADGKENILVSAPEQCHLTQEMLSDWMKSVIWYAKSYSKF